MMIRIGYDISFEVSRPLTFVAMLHVHPSRAADLRWPDGVHLEPYAPVEIFTDNFGNTCSRFVAQPGVIRLAGSNWVEDSGLADPQPFGVPQVEVADLPPEVLPYLLSSRYCEVDLLSIAAAELFGNTTPGWERVCAICNWVNQRITFGYPFARATKSAVEVYNERAGVCRDFQHLAITFCRAMNIPARYATGYLGDIGVPASPTPMDFSAWFEVYLGGQWWACDARHNSPRIGRILMATGRDAADVAITTSFGMATLLGFSVTTDEVVMEAVC